MVFTLLGLVVFQAYVSSKTSTVGVDFSKLSTEIDKYKKENALLKEKLLSVSSYTVIAKEAEDKGFVATSEQMTLGPLPLAHR